MRGWTNFCFCVRVESKEMNKNKCILLLYNFQIFLNIIKARFSWAERANNASSSHSGMFRAILEPCYTDRNALDKIIKHFHFMTLM